MQRIVNLVDLKNPEKMRLLSLSELSIQKRTSLLKFGGQNFIISIDSLLLPVAVAAAVVSVALVVVA